MLPAPQTAESRRSARRRRGAVTIENVIVLAAIALPIVIFSLKVAWPQIRGEATSNLTKTFSEAEKASEGQ